MKIVLLSCLMGSVASAGVFVEGNIQFSKMNPKMNVKGRDADAGEGVAFSFGNGDFNRKPMALEALLGYRFGTQYFVDFKIGYAYKFYDTISGRDLFGQRDNAPFNNANGVQYFSVRARASNDLTAGLALGFKMNNIGASFGVTLHRTRFSVQVKPTSTSADYVAGLTQGTKSRYLFGHEPNIGLEYGTGNLSWTLNVGHTVYRTFKSPRLYYRSDNGNAQLYIDLKPCVTTAKAGIRYHF
jgi:hypothetical protein